ncbi:hypothetical protein D3C78_1317080 [compost metagenome]
MDNRNANVVCGLRNGPCSVPIDGKGDVRLAFRFVNSRIGGGRYYDIRFCVTQRFGNCFRLSEIEFRPAQSHDLQIRTRQCLKSTDDLTIFAGNCKPHPLSPSSERRGVRRRKHLREAAATTMHYRDTIPLFCGFRSRNFPALSSRVRSPAWLRQ